MDNNVPKMCPNLRCHYYAPNVHYSLHVGTVVCSRCGMHGPVFPVESSMNAGVLAETKYAAIEAWNSLPRHSEPETHGRWRYHVEWFNREIEFQEWQGILVSELKGEIVTVQCVGCDNNSGTQTSIMTTVVWREPFTDRPITNEKETQGVMPKEGNDGTV